MALRVKDACASEVLDALTACVAPPAEPDLEENLPLNALRVGMIVAADVYMTGGTLLVAHAYEITRNFLDRARHFRPGSVQEPIRVIIQRTPPKPVRPVPPEVPL